jgi:hypothetical protein
MRSVLQRADGAFRAFTEAVDKSRSDAASQTRAFHDVLVSIHSSAETLAIATERLADLAEDLGTRRVAPKREAIG